MPRYLVFIILLDSATAALHVQDTTKLLHIEHYTLLDLPTFNILDPNLKLYLQEGWLSPTERAVSVISLRHNLATSGQSRRYVVAFTRFASGGIWLPQESLRHILASPGYAPGTIAVNVTWMERGFNACQTHRGMFPSLFNLLRAIARYWSEIATFSAVASTTQRTMNDE